MMKPEVYIYIFSFYAFAFFPPYWGNWEGYRLYWIFLVLQLWNLHKFALGESNRKVVFQVADSILALL